MAYPQELGYDHRKRLGMVNRYPAIIITIISSGSSGGGTWLLMHD
jgi:hypothetical protein